jgi:predicted nucleic acid-binding protein
VSFMGQSGNTSTSVARRCGRLWLGKDTRAGEHAEDLGLRGYDAVHLATALELGDEEVVLVTWDRDLARSGERVGIGVAGIESTD